jgi:ABC-type uncharacterized transport system permease subunit
MDSNIGNWNIEILFIVCVCVVHTEEFSFSSATMHTSIPAYQVQSRIPYLYRYINTVIILITNWKNDNSKFDIFYKLKLLEHFAESLRVE